MRSRIINFEKESKNKKPHSLIMDGVLDAFGHFVSYVSEKGG
jgi:hypothetical protein